MPPVVALYYESDRCGQRKITTGPIVANVPGGFTLTAHLTEVSGNSCAWILLDILRILIYNPRSSLRYDITGVVQVTWGFKTPTG